MHFGQEINICLDNRYLEIKRNERIGWVTYGKMNCLTFLERKTRIYNKHNSQEPKLEEQRGSKTAKYLTNSPNNRGNNTRHNTKGWTKYSTENYCTNRILQWNLDIIVL